MDRSERVLAQLRVGPLREWATTDEKLDEIAAILWREFQAVREERSRNPCCPRWERRLALAFTGLSFRGNDSTDAHISGIRGAPITPAYCPECGSKLKWRP